NNGVFVERYGVRACVVVAAAVAVGDSGAIASTAAVDAGLSTIVGDDGGGAGNRIASLPGDDGDSDGGAVAEPLPPASARGVCGGASVRGVCAGTERAGTFDVVFVSSTGLNAGRPGSLVSGEGAGSFARAATNAPATSRSPAPPSPATASVNARARARPSA